MPRRKKSPLFPHTWKSFSSVTQSCPTLCDPMDHSTPGLPVHHQLLELAQTHVHWVSDTSQPSHPLSSLSPALNLPQHQSLFQWIRFFASGDQSIVISASVLPMNIQGWFPSGLTGLISLQSKGVWGSFTDGSENWRSQNKWQEFSPTSQFKSINWKSLPEHLSPPSG